MIPRQPTIRHGASASKDEERQVPTKKEQSFLNVRACQKLEGGHQLPDDIIYRRGSYSFFVDVPDGFHYRKPPEPRSPELSELNVIFDCVVESIHPDGSVKLLVEGLGEEVWTHNPLGLSRRLKSKNELIAILRERNLILTYPASVPVEQVTLALIGKIMSYVSFDDLTTRIVGCQEIWPAMRSWRNVRLDKWRTLDEWRVP